MTYKYLASPGDGYVHIDGYGGIQYGSYSSLASTLGPLITAALVNPGTAGQIFITNGTPASAWSSALTIDATAYTAGKVASLSIPNANTTKLSLYNNLGVEQAYLAVNESSGVVSLITPNSYALQLELAGGQGIYILPTYMSITAGAGNSIYFGDNAGHTSWVLGIDYPAGTTAKFQTYTSTTTAIIGTQAAGAVLTLQSDNAVNSIVISSSEVDIKAGGANQLSIIANQVISSAQFFNFFSTVASPTISQATPTSDVAPQNLTISPQAPYASAVTNLVAGDVIVNIPASVGAGAKFGGLKVEYNGTAQAAIGTYNNGGYSAIWLGANASNPGLTNFSFLDNGTGYAAVNASGGGLLYFAVGNVNYVSLSSSLLSLSVPLVLEGTNQAAIGDVRAANNTNILSARNAANTADISLLATTTTNDIIIGLGGAGLVQPSTINLDALGSWTMQWAAGGTLYCVTGSVSIGTNYTTGSVLTLTAGAATPIATFSTTAVNIATGQAGIATTIGYNGGTGAGSTQLTGNPVTISSYGGGGVTEIYTTGLDLDWGGSLPSFVVWDLNNLAFHNLATTPKLWQYTASSDVAPVNLTIQAQGPYGSATAGHGNAGDVVINTPASTGTDTKYGGLQFQYNGTTIGGIGVYNSVATTAALWLATTPNSSGNYALYSDGYNLDINAPNGSSTMFFYAGASTMLGRWTTSLFTVNTAATIGSQTTDNQLVGGLKEATRDSISSFTLDTTINDRHIIVRATQIITLSADAHADGRVVTFWIDTTSSGSGGADITLTIAPAATEKINGTNANWSITIPGSPQQMQKLDMMGDGTNIRIG